MMSPHDQLAKLREIHGHLARPRDPFSEFRDQMNTLLKAQEAIYSSPLREIQNQMATISRMENSALGALLSAQKAIYSSPLRDIQDRIGMISRLEQQFFSPLSSLGKIAKQFQSVPRVEELLSEHRRYSENLIRTLAEMRQQNLSVFSRASRYAGLPRGIDLQLLRSWMQEARVPEINEEISEEELTEAETLVEQPDFQQMDVEEKLQRIWEKLNQAKSLTVKEILKWVFLIVLSSFIQFVLHDAYNSVKDIVFSEKARPQDTVRDVSKIVGYAIGRDAIPKDFRIVARETVTVRSMYKRRYLVVGVLSSGRIVRVVNKRKKWSLVEWPSESGEMLHGWVRTKYLKSLIRRKR